ncbi:MAG: nucleotidyltransferase family protein [Planctomycetes bacterium]|nr:nucleotidyltransferase family protein [Planctomycetota bacterium]
MIEFRYTGDALWARMERAVERVNERLRKTVRILEEAKIPYAVVGGHAVRAWVAQVDEGAVRTTRDVNILIRPDDLPLVIEAMTNAGLYYRQTAGLDMFVEQPEASARDAIHMVLSGQMVRSDDHDPNPDVEPNVIADDFRTVNLETLVRMKLNSFRRKDQVHILDMISIGLINETWLELFPLEIRRRLQELLDDPDG